MTLEAELSVQHHAPSIDEYLALRDQIEELKARFEAMKPGIVHVIMTQGGRVRHGDFELCVRQRVTYTYSEYVAAAEAHLAALKQMEQEKGDAILRKYSEFPFVRRLG